MGAPVEVYEEATDTDELVVGSLSTALSLRLVSMAESEDASVPVRRISALTVFRQITKSRKGDQCFT